MTVIAFSRLIGPVPVQCVLSERHIHQLGITENPIEGGAKVNDHAYIEPRRCLLHVADGNAAALFNIMTQFQRTRVPFFLVTGLTVYPNMLIERIEAERDAKDAYILKARVFCREIKIANSATAPSNGAGAGSTTSSASPGSGASAPTPDSVSADVSGAVGGTVQRGDAVTSTLSATTGSSSAAGANSSILAGALF